MNKSHFNISICNRSGNCATPYLEGFDESPKQGANALPSAEELDQPHDSKQSKESDGDASAVLCVLRKNSPKSGQEGTRVGSEHRASGCALWDDEV